MKPSANNPSYYGYVIVAAAFIIQLAGFSLTDSYGVFVNPWASDLGWSRAAISGAYSLSFLVMGGMGILMGIISDKYGPRLALSLCAFFLGAGYILISLMQVPWHLFLFYGVLFGTGLSGVWAPLLSVISKWFVHRRGLVTGIVIAGGGLGAFIGPPLITAMITAFTWNRTTLILGILILAVVLISAQFLKPGPLPSEKGLSGHIRQPLLNPKFPDLSLQQALRTRQFWTVFLMFFCLAFYTFSTLVNVLPYALQLDIPGPHAAFVLAAISGVSILGNLVMGRLGDWMGPQKVLIISFVLMSAALFWLVQARNEWMLFVFSFVFGFNHGGNATAQAPLVARLFGLSSHGSIFGGVAFGFTLGGALGPLITGYIFDLTGNYQPAFLLCGAIGVVGLLLTLILRPAKRFPVAI